VVAPSADRSPVAGKKPFLLDRRPRADIVAFAKRADRQKRLKLPKYSYQGSPSQEAFPRSPQEAKREFARRLQAARLEKGFNQSELARRAAKYMVDKKFGRDLIGPYERALKLPSPVHLSALARALGKTPQELLPYQGVPGSEVNRVVPMDLQDIGDGKAWIRINEQVPWETAIKIIELVRATKAKSTK
jgi:transcriptional regulator with XRE-family HTH domain